MDDSNWVEEHMMEPDRTSVSQQMSELERLYKTAPVGLGFLDAELRYVRINERLAMMNGRSVAAHIGRSMREIVPELTPKLEPVLRELLETGVPIRDIEVSGTTPADSLDRTWLCNYSRVTSSEGRVLGVSEVVQDITETKQITGELAMLQDYLDTILLNMPVGVAILEGEDFRYFRINKVLADMNGRSIDDHLGKTVAQVLPHAQNILTSLRKVWDEAKPSLNREFTTRLPSNPDRHVHLMDFHFPIVVDGAVRAVGAVVIDMTRRKEAEIALRQSQADLEERVNERTAELKAVNVALRTEAAERTKVKAKLRDSEQHLRRLLETTQAIPWTADFKTFQFTYVGPQAVKLLGYPVEQWYGQDFWPDHIHPDDRGVAVDFCLTSSRQMRQYEFEYRMIAADRRIVWIRDLVNVGVEEGKPSLLHGFMIDVTAEREADLKRKTAEHEMRLLREELEHVTRVSSLGALAGSLAHEINQPLSAIVSNAQAGRSFLDRPTPVTDEASEALTEIAEDAKRAGEVIHGLQALLKKKESEKEALDINELVEQVRMLLHSDAVTRAIPIQLDLARNLPQALGDRVQLQQVVLNLMLNGFEAMTDEPPTGKNELTVRTAREEDDLVVVAVQDSGCGLDRALGERVFEAFTTTKPDGLGMGLSVNRSIVEAHGGRIWMTQNPDRGVTVSFTVPVAPVANP